MAYVAEIDSNNVVLRVLKVGDDIADKEAWAANALGGTWKQTYKDGSQRKQYAGINYTYNPEKDIFIENQPYSSWSLDDNDDWQPPIARPTEDQLFIDENTFYACSWNESAHQADNTKGWEAIRSDDTSENPTIYSWNGSSWVQA
jgi:hypothetical protein